MFVDKLLAGGEVAGDDVDCVPLGTLVQRHEGKTSTLVTLTLLLGQPWSSDYDRLSTESNPNLILLLLDISGVDLRGSKLIKICPESCLGLLISL